MFILVVAASIAGVVMLVKRPKDANPVSFDEWPTFRAIPILNSPPPIPHRKEKP